MRSDRQSLTVVTPVRNGADDLRRLWPVMSRELGDATASRWVIVDNGSTDDTPDVLAGLMDRSPLPVHTLQGAGIGPGDGRNAGIDATDTPWVTFVDVDDALEPGCLSAWSAVASDLQPDVLITATPTSLSRRRSRHWSGPPRLLSTRERWSAEVFREWCAGGKVYRVDYLERQGVRFSSAVEAEDLAFLVSAVLTAGSVAAFPTSPRYAYGPPSTTAADRAPATTQATLEDFAHAIRSVLDAAPSEADANAAASPLYAGASAFILRALSFAPAHERRALADQFRSSDSYLPASQLPMLDRRDVALVAAMQVAVRGGDLSAAALSSLYRWSQRRRNRRRHPHAATQRGEQQGAGLTLGTTPRKASPTP